MIESHSFCLEVTDTFRIKLQAICAILHHQQTVAKCFSLKFRDHQLPKSCQGVGKKSIKSNSHSANLDSWSAKKLDWSIIVPEFWTHRRWLFFHLTRCAPPIKFLLLPKHHYHNLRSSVISDLELYSLWSVTDAIANDYVHTHFSSRVAFHLLQARKSCANRGLAVFVPCVFICTRPMVSSNYFEKWIVWWTGKLFE